jgi:hypothetical protein
MKRLAPILILAGTIPGVAPAVEWGLPWFHTRPKPVLLDDRGGQPVSQKMVKRTDYKSSTKDDTARPVWADTHRSHGFIHTRDSEKSRSSSQTNPKQ